MKPRCGYACQVYPHRGFAMRFCACDGLLAACHTNGSKLLKSSRSPTAVMRPASFSSAQLVMPVASLIHTSGSSSITSGGVRLCGSDAGPSRILMAPHGATRTSTPAPGAFSPADAASSAPPSPTAGVAIVERIPDGNRGPRRYLREYCRRSCDETFAAIAQMRHAPYADLVLE